MNQLPDKFGNGGVLGWFEAEMAINYAYYINQLIN
jgi:hypothetical protein